MKDHPDRVELSAYMDSELPASEIGRIGRHLGDCGACAGWVGLHRSIASGLRQDVEAPADFGDLVMRRLVPYGHDWRLTIAASVVFMLFTLSTGAALIGWGLLSDARATAQLGATAAAAIDRALSFTRSVAMLAEMMFDLARVLISSLTLVLRSLGPVLPLALLAAVTILTYLLGRSIAAYRRSRFA
ncbi:MAG: hypothetical protein AB1714_21685 [Acidobacteriota bacterium]